MPTIAWFYGIAIQELEENWRRARAHQALERVAGPDAE
jgi:hypothetical protein